MKREYVMRIKTYPVKNSAEPDSATEVNTLGSSVRIALKRGIVRFQHKLGLKTDYQLAAGQRLTIDIIRVK